MDLNVKPEAYLIGRPQIDGEAVLAYIQAVEGEAWYERIFEDVAQPPRSTVVGIDDSAALVEFMGRLCYRSWDAGLNPNVTKVREDSAEYLRNILGSGHGSVLEHATFNFVFRNVSRVFTHELVRHRAGTAISQESMRFVRLDDIPFWLPNWAEQDEELVSRSIKLLEAMEEHQKWMADHFGLDDDGVPFSEKKHKTSFMRRFAPDGVATTIGFSMNVRAARHIIEMRNSEHAEEEIQLVFRDMVAPILIEEAPLLFGDYEQQPNGEFVTEFGKV